MFDKTARDFALNCKHVMSDNSSVDVIDYYDADNSNDYDLRIAMTDFTKDTRENSGTRAKFITNEDLEIFQHSFEILFYANGCNSENEGFISILFLENRKCPLSSEFVSFTFSCIVSVLDNAGKSRFPQSFAVSRCSGVDEANETEPYTPFGLERFKECKTIMDNFEEFISDDKLTISVVVSLELNYTVNSKHSVNVFYNMKCDDDIEPFRSSDGTTTYKLPFGTPLFQFLKNMSPYFRRIEQSPMSEASSQSMLIPEDEYEAFREVALYVSSGSLRHVANFDELVQLYAIADKYRILKLKESCAEQLKNQMSHQNALDILILADRHSDNILRTTAFRYIRTSFPEIRQTDGWHLLGSFRQDLINEILECKDVIPEERPPVSTNESSEIKACEEQECSEQLEGLEISSYFS